MKIVGIDPGLYGAIAVLNEATGGIEVMDMPVHVLSRNRKEKREIDAHGLARLFTGGFIDPMTVKLAMVEQVGAMPGQGVSSMFAFGKAYGHVLQALASAVICTETVSPRTWKKVMALDTAAKDGSRARASMLFPAYAPLWARKMDDGRAEAVLLAEYGRRLLAASSGAAP